MEDGVKVEITSKGQAEGIVLAKFVDKSDEREIVEWVSKRIKNRSTHRIPVGGWTRKGKLPRRRRRRNPGLQRQH